MCSGRSAISSRNSVPPSADWIRPCLSATAPVKLPFLWPNSSLSISSVGIAPQFTGHERPVAARAGVVDQVRDQLLAGAGLAIDVYRRLAARDALDHLAQLLHGARAAEQLDLRQLQRALAGLAELERGGDQLAQRRDVERLGDEIEGAELERAHRGLDVAVRGDDGHRRLRLVRLDPLDDVQAVAVRQLHVGEAQIERAARAARAWPRRWCRPSSRRDSCARA